ncbi:MAG: FAD synthetase family protein [Verrucomicrobia bacterium]|nr:FAD synthetase family protein [Verrucomicrobiota bacterium]
MPCILTIGNFDGVHRGHQRILHHMKTLAGLSGAVCVVTFSNHPSFVLPGKRPVQLIQSNSLKLSYLEKLGADVVYNLPFTAELSQIRYDAFLAMIKECIPFDYLVLGEGDAFGYKREGTAEKIAELGKQLSFQADYLPKLKSQHETISSGKIRSCIEQGHIEEAVRLLGHPYIIEAPLSPHLCLPPDGNYLVNLESNSVQKQTMLQFKDKKVVLDFPMEDENFFIIFI